MHLIDAEIGGNFLRDALAVTGEHDRSRHAGALQRSDRFFCVWFFHVSDDDVSGIFAIHSDMHDRANAVTFHSFHADLCHELIVPQATGTPSTCAITPPPLIS